MYVIELNGIRIHAPLHRLESDTIMPVYAMGLGESETPFTFGDAIDGLQFEWSVSNDDVIEVEPVFAEVSNFAHHLFVFLLFFLMISVRFL